MGMSDLVKRLRSIDQMSVEDCFLQSYLYTKAAERIEELESMLHLAYRLGLEDVCRCKTYEPDCYQGQESMDEVPDGRWLDIDEIRAIETPADLAERVAIAQEWDRVMQEGDVVARMNVASLHGELLAVKARAEAAESMLPRAYRAGMEAAEKFVGSHVYTTNGGTVSMEPVSPKFVGMDQHHATVARAILAQPTPTATELLTMCAEKESPDE
jgi:hypothetical protein